MRPALGIGLIGLILAAVSVARSIILGTGFDGISLLAIIFLGWSAWENRYHP